MNELDLLAVGAHPDDVELGCGGTLAALAARGVSFGILDLTRGEAGTRGTPEASAASARASETVWTWGTGRSGRTARQSSPSSA